LQSRKLIITSSSFTLVELLITLSILTVIAGSIHLAFSTAISVWRRGEIDMQVYQDGRLVISGISRELSSCLILESSKDITFVGAEDNLKFVTISSLQDKVVSQGSRLIEVYYYLEHDGDTLQREERPLIGSGGTNEEYSHILAEKVTNLSFGYFDGEAWMDFWQEKEELPQAVKITLGLKPSEKSVIFRTTVSIPTGKTITIANEEEIP
jgi:type II secretory pathway component PulJ